MALSASAARQGFWAAIVLAILFLAAAFVSPLAGGSGALIALACAWGILRGHAWAAIAALVYVAAPIVPALRSDWRSVGVTALAEAVFVYFFFRAARELWRQTSHRRVWPWAPAAGLACSGSRSRRRRGAWPAWPAYLPDCR